MAKKENFQRNIFTKVMILIIAVWVLSMVFIIFNFDNWPDRGAFEDLFGVVNTLFSRLAFAGLIYTIFLQKEDLKLHRYEVLQNRVALKKSAIVQENLEKALVT